MDAFIHLNSGGIKCALQRVSGEPGIAAHRINLELEWTATRPDDLESAKLFAGGTLGISFPNRAVRPVSSLQAFYAIGFPSAAQGATQARVDMAALITPDQLEAIERERSGGPIILNLALNGIIFRSPREGALPSPHSPPVQGFWSDLQYQLRPSDWVEVLEHLRYAQGFLIQVPRFDSNTSAKAVEASRDLELAIEHVNEGRYRDSVAACRDALEVAFGATDKDAHPELGYKVENIKAADKHARFWLARQGLWSITHAAKHKDDVAQEINWERRDAVAVITMLSALLEQDPPL